MLDARPDLGVDSLLEEQSIFIGSLFSFMAYGFTILTFILCLRALSKRPRSTSRWIFALYVCSMFTFISAYMALNTTNKLRAFTTNREYPGGPSAWIRSRDFNVICVTGSICTIVSIWLSDGFMLYRAIMIYTTHLWILLFPGILYITSIVTGGLYISGQVQPGADVWSGLSFGIPYYTTSSFCNLTTVLLIAARLCFYRHLVRRVVGNEAEHNAPYENAFTILVESAGLYAAFSACFIVSYALKSAVATLVFPTLCNVRGIASFLIILRAAKQTASSNGPPTNTTVVQLKTECTTPIEP